jgi:hypothetical protein
MNRKIAGILLIAGCTLLAGSAWAADKGKMKMPAMTPEQQAEMDAMKAAGTPGAPHKHLAATAGTYDAKVKMWHDANGPAEESKGTSTRTMALGGRVQVEDFSGSMMGQPFKGHGMSGYNNVTGKYWSTWNDSWSTGIMTSEGTCDAQNACTFTGSAADPVSKQMKTWRMTTKWTNPTTEVFEMYGPDKDGKEMKMMEITYTKRGGAAKKKA